MFTLLPSELAHGAKLLEKDNPKVLVVVGAGISAGATCAPCATWLGLLKHGVEYLVTTQVFTDKRGRELVASLEAAFSPFDLERVLQHAELVEQNLTTPDSATFAAWLEATFHDFHVQPGKSVTLDADFIGMV